MVTVQIEMKGFYKLSGIMYARGFLVNSLNQTGLEVSSVWIPFTDKKVCKYQGDSV
jgi:hypothetical protein